jgi:carbon storage regulator
MLVLSRKVGERILVPHCGLSFTVLSIDGNSVRVGVSAPEEVGVYREEVWERMCDGSRRQEPPGARRGIAPAMRGASGRNEGLP